MFLNHSSVPTSHNKKTSDDSVFILKRDEPISLKTLKRLELSYSVNSQDSQVTNEKTNSKFITKNR